MKPIVKLTAYYLLVLPALLFSCKKENLSDHPPVANAGADHMIILPVNTVILDGGGSTDPDNNIVSYTWSKIFGPPSFSILNTTKIQQAQITNLVEGVYGFELKVTDDRGLFSKDTVLITVIASPPPPPANLHQSFYFSGLKWEISLFDNGVKLIVPAVPVRNANEVTGVATTDQANCNGPWGICYLNDFSYVPKDGTQPGVIYYRIENASVVLYMKSQPFNSYYQSAHYVVLIEF